jgi:hypothetical protein
MNFFHAWVGRLEASIDTAGASLDYTGLMAVAIILWHWLRGHNAYRVTFFATLVWSGLASDSPGTAAKTLLSSSTKITMKKWRRLGQSPPRGRQECFFGEVPFAPTLLIAFALPIASVPGEVVAF